MPIRTPRCSIRYLRPATRLSDPGTESGDRQGCSGMVEQKVFNVAHHHRCYRNRISQRYLTTSRTWCGVRGSADRRKLCESLGAQPSPILGNFPCNGLLYLMRHTVWCYIEAKLTGRNALASSPDHSMRPAAMTVEKTGQLKIWAQLYTGNRNQNAEGETDRPEPVPTNSPNAAHSFPGSNDWPTYRRDCVRTAQQDSPGEMPCESFGRPEPETN